MPTTTDCPACGGHAEPLGLLGTRLHLMCRDCGAQVSVEIDTNECSDLNDDFFMLLED